MKLRPVSLLLLPSLVALGASAAYAHRGCTLQHVVNCAKECTKDEIVDGTKAFLPTIITKVGLDESWSGATIDAVKQLKFGDYLEWVVKFKNAKIADADKQVLYVYVTVDGVLSGANFTGQ